MSECIDEFYLNSEQLPEDIFYKIYDKPNIVLQDYQYVQYMKPALTEYHCEEQNSIIDIYSPTLPKLITEKTDSRYHGLKITNQSNEVIKRNLNKRDIINPNQTDTIDHKEHSHQDVNNIYHVHSKI